MKTCLLSSFIRIKESIANERKIYYNTYKAPKRRFYLCHKNQKEDIQDNARERDEVQFRLPLQRLQSARTAAQSLFRIRFAPHADITKGSKFSQNSFMKTALDPRHKQRQDIVQLLFSYSFVEQNIPNAKAKLVIENINAIDARIEEVAPEFPINKINKVDLAILRLAIYELQFEKKAPPKVIIDEAIELAKEFGGDASPGFVNGALGKLIKPESK